MHLLIASSYCNNIKITNNFFYLEIIHNFVLEIPSVLGGGSHHILSRIVLTGESTIGSYSSSQRKYNNNKEVHYWEWGSVLRRPIVRKLCWKRATGCGRPSFLLCIIMFVNMNVSSRPNNDNSIKSRMVITFIPNNTRFYRLPIIRSVLVINYSDFCSFYFCMF